MVGVVFGASAQIFGRPSSGATALWLARRGCRWWCYSRNVSTLPGHAHIYVHKHPLSPDRTLLSLLPSEPTARQLAIGMTDRLPLSPQSFTANPSFLSILSSVYAKHATSDPHVIQQAAVFASPASGFLHPSSAMGGFIHVSDLRNPPDYGRIAWPEDILGSVEVDGEGKPTAGTWQDSGTYRIVTREGILGLTEFMLARLVDRLRELERDVKMEERQG